MAGKREKPEDIALKLRQVEVLRCQGQWVQEAVRQIGVTVQTYYRWRKEYGGMTRDQLKRLKELDIWAVTRPAADAPFSSDVFSLHVVERKPDAFEST